jgi:hypothetical protein
MGENSEGTAALAEAEKLRKWQAEYDEMRRAKVGEKSSYFS